MFPDALTNSMGRSSFAVQPGSLTMGSTDAVVMQLEKDLRLFRKNAKSNGGFRT